MYIGNGATPGTFAPGSDGNSLSMLGGVTDATRFIVDLTPGQSKTVYWMLTYPLNDGETYPMTIWANSADGDFVQGSHTYAVQSTISAAADKILGTVTMDPPSGIVSVGNILTVTVSGFNLGTIGQQGDAWFQPVGNIDFSPDCFRLVRSEVYIHSIANQCGYGAMPYIDQLYFPGIRTCYSNDLTDYVKYYFVALQECTTTMKVYQKAASGAVQKYSGDFGVAGATLTTTSQGGSVTIAKSVSPLSGGANTTFTWTITYTNNSDYPVGDPQNGNGLVLIDEAVPSYTTYVTGSSNCSGYSCVKYYSTDNGASWNQTEPVPASSVNKLKWYINQTIPAHSSGTVSFQSKVNSGVPGTPVICNSASAQIDDGASMGADGVCANGGVDLELSKVVDDPTPCEDSSATYTITVTNPSATGATNVQVTDLLPTGVTYMSSVPSQGSYNSVTGLWTVGNLNAGNSATLLLTATVNSGTGGQIITNTGNITHIDQTDPLVINNSDHADIFVPSSVAAASSNSPICEGSTIFLSGGPGGMTSYSWTGPNGFSSTLQNPTIPSATSLNAGTYYLTVTNGNCTGDPASTVVVVNTKPTATASSNSPVCEGSAINLSGGPGGMTSYNWIGPNGFSSTLQSPTVSTNATTAMAGTYTLTVTDSNGCTDDESTSVTVNAKPTATASSNSPICEGGSIQLSGGPNGMSSYSWTGPGGWTSSLQNPSRAGATTAMAGSYTLTVTDSNGCADDESTSVTVNAKPIATASSNSAVCEGSTIVLSGGPGGMTSYSWTGPDGFSSSLQNPTIPSATSSNAGTYYLTVTDGGCTSDPANTVVTVNAKPTATASSNSPICEGGTIQLSGGPNGMNSYSWTGPGGWTSSLQNPSRAGATTAMAGTYTLTVTDSNGCTDDESTSVTVNAKPTATASSNSPICEGSTIVLSGGPGGMTSYSWTGPNGFSSSLQNPTIPSATSLNGGTYYLTVTDGGCTSDPASTVVAVNPKPLADSGADRVIVSGDSVVIGGTPTASGGTPLYTYSWTPTTGLNNAGFANPTASPTVSTTYTVTVTDSNGCTDSDDVTVTVIQDCCICGFVYRAGTTEPLVGWEVILEKQTNPWVQVASAITDGNGKYCFCGLGTGYYRVREVVQPNWSQVSPLPNEYLVTLPGGCCDPQSGPFLIFENQQGGPFAVGWEASPIDKLAVLGPWIVLFSVIVAGASLLALRRRRV
ncbi:hypothetical protein ACFLW7_03875 [Chloroflexota bacterium]